MVYNNGSALLKGCVRAEGVGKRTPSRLCTERGARLGVPSHDPEIAI